MFATNRRNEEEAGDRGRKYGFTANQFYRIDYGNEKYDDSG